MRKTSVGLVVIVLAVGACKGKKDETPAGTPTPVAKTVGSAEVGSAVAAGSGSAEAAMGSAAAAPAPVSDFLQKLGEKEGIVIGEQPGAAVEGIADGTKVEVVAVKDLGVGDEQDGEVTVKTGGKTVKLSPARVLLENELQRAPDGKHAVFAPIVACGDLCHTELYVIASDGKRAKISDGGPDVVPAWSPDGTTLAVGSGGLSLVTLADFKVKSVDGYTAPAYAPDGTLYVRDPGGSAFKLAGDKPKRVWKAPKNAMPEGEEGMPSDDPPPVKFDGGKPKFDLPY